VSTAKEFLDKFSDVQPLPHVISTVTGLINDPESTMKDFEEVIKMDPVLVTRLLTLVNSPFYGLAQTVDSISRAVAFLGMKNLNNLIVADALKNIFSEPSSSNTFSKRKLWVHSAAVSICSKMIAERVFGVNGDDAFLCGILHDFGLLIEEQVKSEEFNAILASSPTTEVFTKDEKIAFGTDHCEIGHAMTLDWKMAVTVQEAIRDHHLISDEVVPSSLTGIIQLAEYIASQTDHMMLPNVETVISPPLMAHLDENMDEYTVLLEDLPEEMEKAQAIYG
jgi:HD-like signal output (HDOD) protein